MPEDQDALLVQNQQIYSEILQGLILLDVSVIDEERNFAEPDDRLDMQAREQYLAQVAFFAGERQGIRSAIEVVERIVNNRIDQNT